MSDTCAICLSGMKKTRKTKVLPCGHYFHNRCLEQWKKGTCPMCRKEYLRSRYKISLTVEDRHSSNVQEVDIDYLRVDGFFRHLEIDLDTTEDIASMLRDFGADINSLRFDTE